MHDKFASGQGLKQRLEVQARQRVKESVAGNGADLDQADLFRVGMQAVRFGVHSHPGCRAENGKEGCQLLFTFNHAGNIFAPAQSAKAKSLARERR